MQLQSDAFADHSPMPVRYTSEGANVSPPLMWFDVPEGTRSFAVICEDPDAPGGLFRHWGVFNIPADMTELTEGIADEAHRYDFLQATNDFGEVGYNGPRPPEGHGPHRYFFRVIALNVPELDLEQGCSITDLLDAARGHAIERAEVVGTFERGASHRPRA